MHHARRLLPFVANKPAAGRRSSSHLPIRFPKCVRKRPYCGARGRIPALPLLGEPGCQTSGCSARIESGRFGAHKNDGSSRRGFRTSRIPLWKYRLWRIPWLGGITSGTGPYLKGTPITDVTRILSAIEQGDPSAAEQLLPLVYDELRKLAAQKMAQEQPGQTLQATALVH